MSEIADLTDHVILPAGDLLALVIHTLSGVKQFHMERVLAIAVPQSGEEHEARYWVLGSGWLSDALDDLHVAGVAVPANMDGLVSYWRGVWDGEPVDLEGVGSWWR